MPQALGKDISNVQFVSKILRSLLKKWELKVTTVLKAEDFTKLELDQLIVPLITHKMINSNEDKRKKKKQKDLAPKAYPNDDDHDLSDKDISLLYRKLKTF